MGLSSAAARVRVCSARVAKILYCSQLSIFLSKIVRTEGKIYVIVVLRLIGEILFSSLLSY